MQIRFRLTGIPIVPFFTALLLTFFLGLALSALPTSLAQEEVTGAETAVLRQISFHEPTTTTSSQAGWKAVGPPVDYNFGISVAYVGDINGDGYEDALVGANRYTERHPNQGLIAVYYGKAGGLSDSPGHLITLPVAGAEYGRTVAAGGDINDDGYADILTAAPFGGPDGQGVVFVDYGSPDGLVLGPKLIGPMPGDRFGFALAAGDINNNGFTDVIVGAPGYQGDDGLTDSGAVFLYYGGPDGIDTEWAWRVESFQEGGQLGYAVAVGDFTGNGFNDIAIGAKHYNTDPVDNGAVFVFYGSGQGPGGGPVATLDNADWAYYGEASDHYFGAALASGGDVNGNGFDDLIVGAPGYGLSGERWGALYGFWGSASGLTGELPDWFATEYEPGSMLGTAVAIAGDTNDNGFDEVVAGAPMAFPSPNFPLVNTLQEEPPGVTYLYLGSESGPGSFRDLYLTSDRPGSRFGHALSANGGGGILVGAPQYTVNETAYGAAFGFTFSPISGLTATNSSPTVWGQPTAFAAFLEDGRPAQFDWDFGDGNMATGQFVEHTYEQPGVYTAVVVATTPFGALTAETTAIINVSSEIDPDEGGTLDFRSPMGWGLNVQVPPNAVERRIGLAFVPLNRDEIKEPLPPNPSTYFFDLDPVLSSTHIFLPYISNGTDSDSQTIHSPAPTGSSQPRLTGQDSFPFQLPITITIIYTDDQIRGLDEERLILTYWDGNKWVDAITTCDDPADYIRDLENKRFILQICHLSRFGMVGN
jgi:hypothetical protein